MSVRFTGTQALTRTANLPDLTGFTVCGWARKVANTGTFRNIISIDNGSNRWYQLSSSGSGDTLTLWNGSNGDNEGAVGSVANGIDFFWAIRANNAGSEHRGYLRTAGSQTLTVGASSGTSATVIASATLYVGSSGFSEPFDGRIWNVKLWDRVLSVDELLVESFYRRVMYPNSINFHWWMRTASDTADRSGNARNPAVTGTLTTEEELALWQPSRRIFIPVASAGGGSPVALDGAAVASVTAGGALTHVVPLQGAAITSTLASGSLSIVANLSGDAFVAALGAAQMAHGVPLAGGAAAGATASADLSTTGSISLAGSATAGAAAAAALSLSVHLTGAAVAKATAAAGLSHGVPLGGSASVSAHSSGALSLTATLTGHAVAGASGSGSLTHHVPLSGDAQAGAQGSASLQGSTGLSGAATAGAQAAAALTLVVPLTAQAVANALATGALSLSLNLRGDAIAAAIAGGQLSVLADVHLQGDAVASAVATGSLGVGSGSPITSIRFLRPRTRAVLCASVHTRSMSFRLN